MEIIDTTAKTIPLQHVAWGRCFKYKGQILMRVRHTEGDRCGCVYLDSGEVIFLVVSVRVQVVEVSATVRSKV